MTWKTIRLELARTADFPDGSAAHAYVLRLPLNANGLIERDRLNHPDERPVVRRFWPHEPDKQGVVIPSRGGWAFSYAPGEDDNEGVFHLENHPIEAGNYLTITETDGQRLPFKVVRCHD